MRRLALAVLLATCASAAFSDDAPSLRPAGSDPAVPTFGRDADPEMIGDAQRGGSHRPMLSGDGGLVVFESTARLIDDDNDRRRDVYLYDRSSRTYRRFYRPTDSRLAAGIGISFDGSHVAYHINDVSARQGVDPVTAILLVDLAKGDTRRVPPPWRGESVKGEALFPLLTPRGAHVVFTSNGPGLSGRARTPIRQVYVYDRASEEIRLVSRADDGAPANRACAEARISDDARYVAFLSAATNLAAGLPKDSLAYRLYLADRDAGTLLRLDEIERGIDPKGWIVNTLDMDGAGESVVFEARERKSGRAASDLDTTDLFLFERSSGTVTRLTSGIFSGRSRSPSISRDGRWIVFALAPSASKQDTGGVVIYDRERDIWRMVANGRCVNPSVSGDGRWIAFESADPVLTRDKKNAARVFVVANPSREEDDAGH